MNIVVLDGPYQLHIHILELRDLHGSSAGDPPSPVVEVDAYGFSKFSGTTRKNVHNCVLNETLGFELPHMTHQILDDGLITMNVFDAGGGALKGNRLIGSTTWDFEATYVLLPALCSGPRVT